MRMLLCAVVVMSGWLGGCATQASLVPLENAEGKSDAASVGFKLREAGDEADFSLRCEEAAGCDVELHVTLDEAFLEDRFAELGLPLDEPHPIASLTFYDDRGEPHEETLSTAYGCPEHVSCSEDFIYAQKTLRYAALPKSATGDYVLTVRRVDDQLPALKLGVLARWAPVATKDR